MYEKILIFRRSMLKYLRASATFKWFFNNTKLNHTYRKQLQSYFLKEFGEAEVLRMKESAE